MSPVNLLFERQGYHFFCLAVLMMLVFYLSGWAGVNQGEFLGAGSLTFLWLSIGAAVAHQFFIWFAWRTELHCHLFTRRLGNRAFPVYAALFILLLSLRFLLILLLGYANRGNLPIHPLIRWGVAGLIFLPVAWTGTSIKRYFPLKRVLGIDHFDPAYQSLGLVRKGIFRYTSNAMYLFVALIFWIPALVFISKAALIAAFFNHAYLWVHYFTVEKPDISRIYGK